MAVDRKDRLIEELGADFLRRREYYLQGAGVPAFTADEGARYWDIVGNNLFINDAGINTWQLIGGAGAPHQLLDPPWHTDTVAHSPPIQGDTIYADATPEWNALPIGAAGTLLRSTGAVPAWATLAAAGIAPNTAPYVTMALDAGLTSERVLTGGTGLTLVDGGAGGLATLNVNSAAPAFTYGLVNAVGIANTFVRTDASLAVFDAVAPDVIQCDDAAATGAAAFAARRDHQHGIVCVAPVNIGNANAEGAATSFPRSDHVHNHPAGLGANLHHNEVHVVNSTGPHAEAGLTIGHVLRASGAAAFSFAAIAAGDLPGLGGVPNLTLSVANAAGAAATYVQTDASVAIFDAVVPTTIQCDDAAATGGVAFAARRDHTHGMPCVVPVNIGVANVEGTAYDFVRSDHVHAHPAALGVNLHHNEVHVVNSTGPHAEAGLTIGHMLRATAVNAFSFAAIAAGDLPAHTHAGAGQGGATISATLYNAAATVSAIFTHSANVILDDGVSHSPAIRFIPQNNDVWTVFAENDGTVGNSDLVVTMPAADADAKFIWRSSTPADVAWVDAAGAAYFGGYVGINVTGPTNMLHVYDGYIEVENTDSDASAAVMFTNDGGQAGGTAQVGVGGTTNANAALVNRAWFYGRNSDGLSFIAASTVDKDIRFYTKLATEVARIDANGNFGIEATVPLAKTHIDNVGTIAQPVLFLDQGDVSEQHIVCSINGADVDFPAIIELDVTGTPTLWWDESLNAFGLADSSLTLEDTTTATIGNIFKDTSRFIHNFHHPTGDTQVPDGDNTFVGVDAGNFTMGATATQVFHGSHNTVMGVDALQSNTIGYYNTAVGKLALFSNTEGFQNAALGGLALNDNTTGYRNTAIGYNTGRGITTGDYNTILGANVIGLAANLSNTVIIADGAGNQRIYVDSAGDTTFDRHILPDAAKSNDIGDATHEWDDLYYVTSHVGTSRLVDSTRNCPVCGERMKRGTGTLAIQGEEADYAIVFCVSCGNVAMEEWNHLPAGYRAQRRIAPAVILEDVRVKGHGRSRQIAIDFRYGDGDGMIRNSTRLGELEAEAFVEMTERDRKEFLLELGEREWASREESRLMLEEAQVIQATFDDLTRKWIGQDLLM